MARTSPFEFIQQVRREVAKVTWPSRKETGITTVMVFGFVIIAALFFFVVDSTIAVSIKFILGLGG